MHKYALWHAYMRGFEKFDEVNGVYLYRKLRPNGETFSFVQNCRVSSEIK
ncbi:MAG: hypothetical protein JSV57_00295 [Candidatus Bathyarchaeota archaeon]|nr:MAG: hypothetical protein JSV57_00295 [Candidatus Bathyarchaeota archaeon]